MRVVALVPDLMDRSRLGAAARAGDVELVHVGAAGGLAAAVEGGADAADGRPVDLVLVDLGRPGAVEAATALRGVRVVGFASHVDGPTLDAAAAAGVEALARSVFFRRLPELLTRRD